MRGSLACFALLVLAAPASAGNHELTIGSSSRALRSSSADAVTANSLEGGTLTYARALDLPVIPKLTVWAEAGFAWASTRGSMFQTMATDVGSTTLTLGGRARYVPYSHLAVSGRF